MAKTATRTATKPPVKPAPKEEPRRTLSKAQQAARHQGRPEPKDEERKTVPVQPKSTAVAVKPGALPPMEFGSDANMPAFMRKDVQAGLTGKENIGNEDIEIPRLKLMQGLSKELEDYNDLRKGNFFHTASETIFDEPFEIVPVYLDRGYILWKPRDAGGGILARAPDGIHWSPSSGEFTVQLDKKDGGNTVTWKLAKTVQQSGLANWGTMNPSDSNSPPAATLMYNVVCAFPGHPDLMPAALTFQRSSIKIGRRFNTKLKTVRTPLFGLKFLVSSFDDSNSRGQDFKNVLIQGAGMVTDENQYNMYKMMHEGLRQTGLKIKDLESVQDEDVGTNEGDEENGEAPTF